MKYKSLKSFLTILLIACINIAKCQVIIDSLKSKNDYIINTTVYKKGIYKSFEEFKYNAPSIISPFTFNKNNVWLLEDEDKGERVKKDEYWGFCDGEKIYIRWNKNYELLEKGRYCFFEAKEVNILPVVSSGMPIPVPIPDKDALIINFNNGKVFEMNKKLFEHILATDDPELSQQFKKEKQKGTKYLEYIVRYNERNSDKVK
jgi:hypothetical protein